MHGLRWLLASSCIAAGFSAAQAQGVLDSTPSISIPVQPESIVIAPNSDTAPTPANSNGCDSFCQSRFDSLWNRPTLTGDWNGLRPRLQEQGITIGGNITQFGFGVGGGINRPVPVPLFAQGDTSAYTGRGEYEALFNLDKFGGMPHGTLLVRAQHWWGQYGNVSFNTGAFPPAVFPAALPPTPNDQGVPYLTDFLLTQPLSKEWVVFAGKKNVIGGLDQDDFAGGNGIAQFMNQALIANPALF